MLSRLKGLVPHSLKRIVWDTPGIIKAAPKKLGQRWRRLTAGLRGMPNFIIIGCAKSGTTSLLSHLEAHPGILMAFSHEVEYWNYRYDQPIERYLANFPLKARVWLKGKLRRRPIAVGERSHDYLMDPGVLPRLIEHMPNVKVIVMLRNPVNRAYSHYISTSRRREFYGRDHLSFEKALEQEHTRMTDDEYWLPFLAKRPIMPKGEPLYNYRYYGYRWIGQYAQHLRPWVEQFPADQMLIIRSEDFFAQGSEIYEQVLDFLGVSSWQPPTFAAENVARYKPMSEETRAELAAFYEPLNKDLEELLTRDFDWH